MWLWQQDRWQPRIRPSCQSCDFGCITLGRNAVWRVTCDASQHGSMVDPRMNVLIEQGVLGELFSVGEATGHCGILHGTVLPRDFCVLSENGVLWKPQFWGIPLWCGKPNVSEDVPRCSKMCSQVHRSVPFPMLTPWHPLRVQDAVSICQPWGTPANSIKQHQTATFLGRLPSGNLT